MKRLVIVPTLLIAALALTGCQDDKDGGADATPETPTGSTSTSSSASESTESTPEPHNLSDGTLDDFAGLTIGGDKTGQCDRSPPSSFGSTSANAYLIQCGWTNPAGLEVAISVERNETLGDFPLDATAEDFKARFEGEGPKINAIATPEGWSYAYTYDNGVVAPGSAYAFRASNGVLTCSGSNAYVSAHQADFDAFCESVRDALYQE